MLQRGEKIAAVIGIALALFLVALDAEQRPRPAPEAEIRAVLDRQVAAWNGHDLQGFMNEYWRSPELTFYSGGAVTSGWDATLERYKKRYQSEGTEMGTLAFDDLEVHMLGPNAAWVGGRWRLQMSGGKKLGGLFTLIFRRMPEGWRIVHDHTSAE